jgi:hypothetical protein
LTADPCQQFFIRVRLFGQILDSGEKKWLNSCRHSIYTVTPFPNQEDLEQHKEFYVRVLLWVF